MRKFFILCVLGLAAIAACRSDSNSNVDAPKGADGNGADGVTATTVKAIRMTQPTNGTVINLQNVVVTAHVTSSKYGHIWVQDQGGGPYSGIQLFCNYAGTTPTCMMTRAQLDALVSGTVVNVSGKFSSFLLATAPAGAQPNLEIDAPMITTTGANMAAVAVDVAPDVVAFDQLAATAAEPYKGALVHVTGTAFPASNVAAPEFASTCQDKSMPPLMGSTFGGFNVTGGTKTLSIGLNFYSTVTYCLPCTSSATGFNPYPCVAPALVMSGENFTGLKGIVEPQYNKRCFMGPTPGTACMTDANCGSGGTCGRVFLEISPTSDSDMPHT